MQTLQNHKIDSASIVRHSENCKENLTAKPRNDGNRVNSGLLFATVEAVPAKETYERLLVFVGFGFGGKFLGERVVGALLVPEDADDPPAFAIISQLDTVNAAGEGRFTGGVAGFVAAEDLGDVAKRLDAADDGTFEKAML